MDSDGSRPTSQAAAAAGSSNLAPGVLEAISAPRTVQGSRRCFICLTDEEPTDKPSDWVDPCPCTLEAHQDCMLSWVTDCERSGKPLICPVCKSRIRLEGPWDPIVDLHDRIQKHFTRASPFLLATGVSTGIQFSLQMYGAMALWTFAGREAFLQFVSTPNLFDGAGKLRGGVLATRMSRAMQLTTVGPALLLGQLLPGWADMVFVPLASLYGMYHAGRDDHFFSWPPSPHMAVATFPYVRSIYYKLWREFVYPYEANLNRQLQGLPPLDPATRNGNGNNVRNGHRRHEGGIIGILQGLADALEGDDEEGGAAAEGGNEIRIIQEEVDAEAEADGDDGEVLLEVVIEGVIGDDEATDEELEEEAVDVAQPRDAEQQPRDQPQHDDDAAAPPAEQAQQEPNRHEAPVAPPARGPGLGSILSNMSNALVGSMMLPATCFVMGELLSLMLPASWTATPRRTRWGWSPDGSRPGLLNQQWGRSLLGGCLWVVMRDAVRLYTKHRKVANLGIRRVKNVERRRNRP